MLRKRRYKINKKASLQEIYGAVLIFSFASIMYLSLAIINFAVLNDYMIFELQNISETLEGDKIVKNGTSAFLQTQADQFRQFNFHFDDLWFFIYILFVVSTLTVAYRTKHQNYFGFLAMLFYGLMFLLFLLTIFTTITDWWNEEILLKILPNVVFEFPKFYFYLDNIGIFTAIHLVICMIINQVDFDIAKRKAKKKQEQMVFDDEVV